MSTLAHLRRPLLDLHKTLVDAEREDYERTRGRMSSGAGAVSSGAGPVTSKLVVTPRIKLLSPLSSNYCPIIVVQQRERGERVYQLAPSGTNTYPTPHTVWM